MDCSRTTDAQNQQEALNTVQKSMLCRGTSQDPESSAVGAGSVGMEPNRGKRE